MKCDDEEVLHSVRSWVAWAVLLLWFAPLVVQVIRRPWSTTLGILPWLLLISGLGAIFSWRIRRVGIRRCQSDLVVVNEFRTHRIPISMIDAFLPEPGTPGMFHVRAHSGERIRIASAPPFHSLRRARLQADLDALLADDRERGQ